MWTQMLCKHWQTPKCCANIEPRFLNKSKCFPLANHHSTPITTISSTERDKKPPFASAWRPPSSLLLPPSALWPWPTPPAPPLAPPTLTAPAAPMAPSTASTRSASLHAPPGAPLMLTVFSVMMDPHVAPLAAMTLGVIKLKILVSRRLITPIIFSE